MVSTMPHAMTAAYNASKAAVSQYTNTLRLELEPVNVKVIELVTGRVRTGLIEVPTLDDASIYKPLEPTLQSRAKEAGMKSVSGEPIMYKLTRLNSTRENANARSICKSRCKKSPFDITKSLDL